MRIYTLQVHTTGDAERLDDLYHYSDFNNLLVEFENKVARLKDVAELMRETDPKMDENGEVRGGFTFANQDGTHTIGAVYDYDILDER